MPPILPRLDALAAEVASRPRLPRDVLMQVLRDCYEVGLSPIPDDAREHMWRRVGEVRRAEGAGRVFALRSRETPYTLIVRYVFASKAERSNASRYATVLAYCAGERVSPLLFRAYVHEAGGLTTLYWQARRRSTKTMTRNKLTLSTSITCTAGQPITLRLLPQANGVFNVLEVA